MSTHTPKDAPAVIGPESVRAEAGSRLVQLLDREIEETHRRATWSGWTPWVLLTGTVALVWMALSRLEEVRIPAVVFVGAVAALLGGELVQRARTLLMTHTDDAPESRVLVSTDLLRGERPALVIEILFAVLIWWGMRSYFPSIGPVAGAATIAWAALVGSLALIGLAYSFWPVPFPEGIVSQSLWRLLAAGLPLALLSLSLLGCTLSLVHSPIPDVRVGLLIGAAAVLLLKLAAMSDEPPLFGALVELRRDLLLGKVELSEAMNRARVIVEGMRLEDYVQQDARRMLQSMEAMRPTISRIRPLIAEMEQHTALLMGGQIDAEGLTRLMERWDREGGEVDQRYERVARWRVRYARRLDMAAVFARLCHLPYEGEALVVEINAKADPVLAELKIVLHEYHAALDRLQEAMESAGLTERRRIRSLLRPRPGAGLKGP